MSKIDNVTKELGLTDRPLRDDELKSVIGGFMSTGEPRRPVFGVTAWAIWVCCRTIVLRRAFSHVFRRGPSRPAQVSGLASSAPPDRTRPGDGTGRAPSRACSWRPTARATDRAAPHCAPVRQHKGVIRHATWRRQTRIGQPLMAGPRLVQASNRHQSAVWCSRGGGEPLPLPLSSQWGHFF